MPRHSRNSTVAAGGRAFDAGDFIGGALSVDFVNSVDSWFTHPVPERLGSFTDWLSWSAAARSLPENELRSIERRAAQDAAAARRALERARAARDALHEVFRARLQRRTPTRQDFETVNACISAAREQRKLVYGNGAFVHAWAGEPGDPQRLLWPVMLDAEALLVDADALQRLHECPAARCGWLFLDTSRNRSRRWCSMRTCGNVAKAQRHYARIKRARHAKERRS
jgi:predicted RNA-binding Zn ribbon-like protein